ncbi:peptidylprolyl isomerase [Azospirillum sp. TSA6c]|uniref:tetratricopeptide repeat protein n=1 Tax=Azospirillum sp. TSA6c TaxID=709813 RepID=UPI000D60A258|nr:tetratricopeptide repeat protein [Azospirillum sp. TSA6c]PWC51687.1 peptidylprolyl isomerase [Azospirillum sp. TSA6c]
MTLHDTRGLAVSTRNRSALERYEAAVDLLNGYYLDFMAVIDGALEEDPGFVMGHCFKAGVYATCNEAAVQPELRRCVEAAEALSAGATDRERAHIAAARAWLEGDLERSAALYGRIVQEHPRDILALQIAHVADFFLGESRMLRDRVAQVLPHWDESVPGFGYVLGMHAFGLEQTNLYGRAEESGRWALAFNDRDPWAIHAVAHVMEMQGRIGEGVEWLETRRAQWADNNAFSYHNWWHLALYHLEQGETERVLSLYDMHIRSNPASTALELVDGSALLWRLHLRGVDVGDRWRDVADCWERAAADGFYAFNDTHAMMAFVADGRDDAADRTLAAQEQAARRGQATGAMMARDVGLPVCRALRAFGRGEYRTAAELLYAVRTRAHRFGGSHAQRDILDLTLVEAAIRSGDLPLAQALTAERSDLKPSSPANRSLTARAMGMAEGRGSTGQPSRTVLPQNCVVM